MFNFRSCEELNDFIKMFYGEKIKKILKIFFVAISFIFSHRLCVKVLFCLDVIYTYWLCREFNSFGKKSIMHCPIYLRGAKYITVGNNTGLGARGILTAWDKYMNESFFPEIIIGDNVWIGEYSHITSINRIYIGNNVLMGKCVTISDNSHGLIVREMMNTSPIERPLFSKGSVIINENVWIGDKVTILANVVIGRNAIIGANSVVSKNVPENAVVGGNPARIIKMIE